MVHQTAAISAEEFTNELFSTKKKNQQQQKIRWIHDKQNYKQSQENQKIRRNFGSNNR